MARSGNDWRSGGGSSRGRRPAGMDRPQPPAKEEKAPVQAKDRSDWRKKKLGEEDKGKAAALAGKDYLRRRDHTQRQKTFRHRLKVGAGTALVLLLLVALLVYLLYRPQQVTLVEVIVTEYRAPLPPNSYALEDGTLLDSLESSNRRSIKIDKTMDATRPKGEFLAGLDTVLKNVKPGGPNKNTTIVYLSAHGVVNESNDPCLLLSGADPLDSDSWLPVVDLLKLIEKATSGHEKETVNLLVLDSGRIDELWDAGLLYNGFADALARAVQAAEVKNLYVLHSCSPGERNWSGPEINGSAFGHYVARGLNGAADLNEDRTISLSELQAYVRMRVNQWARIHRGAQQNPQLIPALEKNAQVLLAYRWSQLSEPPALVDTAPVDHSKQINNLWIEHERLLDEARPYRHDPVGWAELQEDMLRLEGLLLAGDAYSDKISLLASEIANEQRVLGTPPADSSIGPRNLPLSEQLHGLDSTAPSLAALQEVMHEQAHNIPHDIEKGPPPKPASYLQALAAAWQWLLDADAGELTHQRMIAARDMIESAPPPNFAAEPIEGHYLRMLNRHIDWVDQPGLSKSLLGTLVRQSLASREVAELAATPADERTIYWVQQKVDQADQQRRLAEDRLFVGSSVDAIEARNLLVTAGDSPDEGLYGEALADIKELSLALATRDRTWSEMRYLAAWSLWRIRAGSPNLVGPLNSLLNKSHELGVALDDGLSVEQIAKLRGEVETARKAILDDYFEQVRRLTRTSSVDQNTIGQILEVLRLPLYTGTHRNDLRRRLIEELAGRPADRANEETIERPQEILKAYDDLPAWKSTDDAYLAALAALSEHPALAMVDPGKLAVPDAVNWSAPRRVAPPTDAQAGSERARQAAIASLAEQGADLRRQLNAVIRGPENRGNLDRLYQITRQRMDNEFQSDMLDARRGLSTADRLCRAAGPLMPELLSNSIRRAGTNPTSALRGIDRYFQCLWLAHRTMNDFWGPTLASGQYYFEASAQDLLVSASRLQPSARFRQYKDQPLDSKLAALLKAADDSISLSAREIGSYAEDQEARLSGSIQSKAFLPEGIAAISLTSEAGEVFPLKVSSEIRRRFAFAVGTQPHDEQINHTVLATGDDDIDLRSKSNVVLGSFFRGHEFSALVPVRDGEIPPNTIVTLYDPIRPPEVLVQGDVQQIPSVLFVFDCSGSMDRPASGEQTSTRMKVARDRLASLLGRNIHNEYRLPDRRFRVGFIMYGHRVGWKVEAPSEKRFNHAMIADNIVPESLHPSDDVETIVPITLLNEKVRDEIAKALGDAGPFGQTPLYYSINKALMRFVEDGAPIDTPRQIVILTDGEDDPGKPRGSVVTAADITKMLAQPEFKSVRIDLVAFDFKAGTTLGKIVTSTGGKIHPVTDSAELEAAFDELLAPIKYHVQQASNDRRFPDLARPLSSRVPITDWNLEDVQREPKLAQYKVDVFGASPPPSNTDNLELLGGEALVLEYNQDSRFNRLQHLEYDPPEFNLGDKKITQNAPTPDDPQRKFLIKSFIPKRDRNELHFDISVQDSRIWPFTPRPERMWVEIRPADVSSNSEEPLVFNFFDHSLVQGKPVPVYRYTVQEWPKKASEAEVRVWMLMHELTPDFSQNISMNDEQFQITNETLRQQLPGTQISVKIESGGQQNPYQVTVTESIAPGGPLYGTCVDIWPRPDSVEHRYQETQAQHKFVFNKGVDTKPRLDIWSRKTIEEQAVPIADIEDKPMRVKVPELLN